jgi:anti-sigma factor RsiW
MMEQKRGRLSSVARADLLGHVRTCDACKQEEAIDSVLDVALSRLTAEPPPSSTKLPPLRTRLEAVHAEARWSLQRRLLWGLFGLAALGLAVVFFPRGYVEPDPLVREAVNDHVRVLSARTPVEVTGDAVDRLTPQLAPRLDFSPVNAFGGDQDTKLVGASVAYFVDRPAAAFVYQRESHTITVLVFRAEGLPWRGGGSRYAVTTRGYRAVMFRHGDLGYAIVSDVTEAALLGVAAKVDSP